MPNWCGNQLSISGPSDALLVFALAAKGNGENGDLSLNNLHPCHQDLRDVSAGSHDIAFDVMFGDLERVTCYAWIPADVKEDREKLIEFLSAHYRRDMREIGQKMKDNLDKYGSKNWYEWSLANWGTKWDVDGSLSSQSDEHLSYNFDSAWSPPIEAFQKISEDFPELTFDLEYFEPGMCFAGKVTWKNGSMVYEDHRNWSSDDGLEEIRDCGDFDFAASEAENLLEQMKEWEEEEAERASASV